MLLTRLKSSASFCGDTRWCGPSPRARVFVVHRKLRDLILLQPARMIITWIATLPHCLQKLPFASEPMQPPFISLTHQTAAWYTGEASEQGDYYVDKQVNNNNKPCPSAARQWARTAAQPAWSRYLNEKGLFAVCAGRISSLTVWLIFLINQLSPTHR